MWNTVVTLCEQLVEEEFKKKIDRTENFENGFNFLYEMIIKFRIIFFVKWVILWFQFKLLLLDLNECCC